MAKKPLRDAHGRFARKGHSPRPAPVRNAEGRFAARPAPKRRTKKGGSLDPQKLMRALVESLANEASDVSGSVEEVINRYNEVWHWYAVNWDPSIALIEEYLEDDEIVTCETLFSLARHVFGGRYRGYALSRVDCVRYDAKLNREEHVGYRTISETIEAEHMWSQIPDGLQRISIPGGSRVQRAVGMIIALEVPAWYAEKSTNKPTRRSKKYGRAANDHKRDSKHARKRGGR